MTPYVSYLIHRESYLLYGVTYPSIERKSMFHTHNLAKIHFPEELQTPGTVHWRYVCQEIHVHWFHISYYLEDANNESVRLVLMTPYLDLLLSMNNNPDMQLLEVNLVTPEAMNDSTGWEMAPLASVYESSSAPGTNVFQMKNGKIYSDLLSSDMAMDSELNRIWHHSTCARQSEKT